MRVIYCYNIIGVVSLCELVSVSDTGGLNIKDLQISIALPQYKFIPQSQYFVYSALSFKNLYWNEWLSKGSGHLNYEQFLL